MPRLFSGIEIPTELGERLAMLRSGLSGARWIDPDNYHMTLRFIGDVDDVTGREFAAQLEQIRSDEFDLCLQGLGSFGGRRPRAVWAGIAPSDALTSLQRTHEMAARAAGLPPEGRNFTPHVTLARLRNGRAAAVAAYLEANGAFQSAPFRVDHFVLLSSRASTGGGPYVIEEAYPLGTANGA
ncbi:MAG: RNA 2',3'-cyclic phosphodiesterase [Methyloligellaceae bacterium]